MIKNIAKFAAVGAILASGAPVMANEALLNTSTSANNSSQNVQSNSGAVNLSPMGGSNANYQINSVSNSQFGFAPGIQCPTPELAFGAFGGQTNGWGNTGYDTSGNNIGGTIMFTMPIGGDTAAYCKKLAQQIALQRELDTDLNMIKQCAIIARENIQVDTTAFPNFKRCSGVMVDGKVAIPAPNDRIEIETVFTEPVEVTPVIPIRKD